MNYNHLKLKPDFSIYVPADLEEPERTAKMEHAALSREKEYHPISVYIDGRSLIDIVREIEEPVCAAENALHAPNPKDRGKIKPGDYVWLPASLIFPPSRNLLGESFDENLEGSPVVEAGELHYGKSVLLGCPCTWIACWFLVVKITFTPDTVIWSDFGQYWLGKEYDMGPFIFDRKQYESELIEYTA